jgi:hypothetical protein
VTRENREIPAEAAHISPMWSRNLNREDVGKKKKWAQKEKEWGEIGEK